MTGAEYTEYCNANALILFMLFMIGMLVLSSIAILLQKLDKRFNWNLDHKTDVLCDKIWNFFGRLAK